MIQQHPRSYAEIAPKLAQLSQDVLFGDVWERPGLSKRDRSLITVASLVARHRPAQLPFHMKLALTNGVTADELVELITHLAFYAGWPNAVTAAEVLASVLEETQTL
jgi:4-carboxymuconolactone decarboxylase